MAHETKLEAEQKLTFSPQLAAADITIARPSIQAMNAQAQNIQIINEQALATEESSDSELSETTFKFEIKRKRLKNLAAKQRAVASTVPEGAATSEIGQPINSPLSSLSTQQADKGIDIITRVINFLAGLLKKLEKKLFKKRKKKDHENQAALPRSIILALRKKVRKLLNSRLQALQGDDEEEMQELVIAKQICQPVPEDSIKEQAPAKSEVEEVKKEEEKEVAKEK